MVKGFGPLTEYVSDAYFGIFGAPGLVRTEEGFQSPLRRLRAAGRLESRLSSGMSTVPSKDLTGPKYRTTGYVGLCMKSRIYGAG